MHGSSLPSGKCFLFLSYASSVLSGHHLKTQQGNKHGSFPLFSLSPVAISCYFPCCYKTLKFYVTARTWNNKVYFRGHQECSMYIGKFGDYLGNSRTIK